MSADEPAGQAAPRGRRPHRPERVAAVICAIGLTLTAVLSWASARVDDSTEQRLLEVQTKQIGAVLSTTIGVIQAPLSTALAVQRVAGPGDTSSFEKSMAAAVGPDAVFVSASLWQRRDGRVTRLATVGVEPALSPAAPATQAYVEAAFDTETSTVLPVTAGEEQRIARIAYALADPQSQYVVYAERTIPESRRAQVDRDPAFADLQYAIYLGPSTEVARLTTTNVDPATLPFPERTATVVVPFGDTVLTIVTSPRGHLGASLSKRLPLIVLVGGGLLTVVAALVGQQLVRRRRTAEESAATVTRLYDRVESLYGQQRDVSERLQRALLPPVIPDIPQLEVAVDYVAGARGVDIGGDWYSIVALDQDRFAFVVGDVSGSGIDAVAVMARARFTLRAYLLRGDSPATALEMCSHQFDITTDGHITTALVGVGSSLTGEITVANAGHCEPLLLTQDGAAFVATETGPPLGSGPSSYGSTTFTLPAGATLLGFTDGLVERRTEGIDTGMQRLAATVEAAVPGTVADLVTHTVQMLRTDDTTDDIAVLALRRATSPSRRFTGDLQAPAQARSFVASQLGAMEDDAGLPPEDSVVIVVSELVTNAVRAGARTIEVQLHADAERLDLGVTDDADGWPVPRDAPADDQSGRGLTIVEHLADSWRTTASDTGKTVTATWLRSR